MSIPGIGGTTPRISPHTSTNTTATIPPSNALSTISSYAVTGTSKLLSPFTWILSTVWLGARTVYNFFFSSKGAKEAPSEKTNQTPEPIPTLPFPKADRGYLSTYFTNLLVYLDKVKSYIVYTVVMPSGEVKQETGLESMQKGTEVISLEDLNMATKEQFAQAVKKAAEENYGSSLLSRTNYQVVDADSIDAALNLDDPRPIVLNMANAFSPGGGVVRGAKAQEEAICRRTALYHSISPDHNYHLKNHFNEHSEGKYHIPKFGCIYSPSVPILHLKNGNEYQAVDPSDDIPSVSFVSSAAYNLRQDRKNPHPDAYQDEPQSFEEYIEGTRLKIRSQLYTAVKHGHKSIVLGAFGCGAFRNNPELIARFYRDELAPVQKYFENVVFAVLVVNKRTDNQNLYAFKQEFGTLAQRWGLR